MMKPGNESTDVPAILCGTHSETRRQWRAIVKRAVAEGSWQCVNELEFVPLSSTPGDIMLRDGPPSDGEHLFVNHVFNELYTACLKAASKSKQDVDYEKWYGSLKSLTVEGCDQFWFCLGFLANGCLWFPYAETYLAEKKQLAGQLLPKLLRWWDHYVANDLRYGTSVSTRERWPCWVYTFLALGGDLDIPQPDLASIHQLKPSAALLKLRDWASHPPGATETP